MEQVQMLIPEKQLLALTELLSGKAAQDSSGPFLQRYVYKITESNWSCFLEQTGNDPWLFCPIGPVSCDSAVISNDLDSVTIPWSINKQLSERVQNSIREMELGRRLDDLSCEICVFCNASFGNILGVRCRSFQLVATTLQTWGKPPESVIRDWQNQLKSIKEQPTRPSTAETLATEDGLLIFLSRVLKQLDARDGAKIEWRTDFGNPLIPKAASFFCHAPDWPDRTPIMQSQSGVNFVIPISDTIKSAGTLPRKRKSNMKMLYIGSAAAITFVLALTFWLLSPVERPPKELVAGSSEPKAHSATPNSGELAAHDKEPAELQELVTTAEPNFSEASSFQPDMTVEALLAQLRPNNEGLPTLDNLSASSIISEALSPAGKDLTTIPTDEVAGSESEAAEASDTKALDTVLSERGYVSLKRPLRIQAAITKETAAIGKPVLTKACRCEIELKLTEKLIVEPMERVTIEGASKASWKIAIEDEAPELVFEIASKPGSKWQVIVAVGLRETPGAIPIWLGPREAQVVGNRLIDYRQWIGRAIETLRTARSNSRGRSSIDFAGEIKKLERQEKEAEKAIDRWKVIARLSHFFFDSNEIQIQFTAVVKD